VYELAHVAALIERNCPELAPVQVARLGRGWDHDVFVANGRWVFRFPRNAGAAEALIVERELLPWLVPQLPVPVPNPHYHGVLDETSGWLFAGYALLPGSTVCDVRLDSVSRAALAPVLGRFLRALHALNPLAAPAALPGERLRRLDVEYRGPQARQRLIEFRESALLPRPVAERLLTLCEAPATPLPLHREVIVHCDVHSRNVLVEESGSMSGVLDWVDVHRGDRVHDLVAPFELLPARARAAFFDHYGSVDEVTLQWARWRAVCHTAGALAGAVEREDSSFAQASRQALLEIVEDA
jgi:aminoglycoside phosphotransferase (APT) family kinase protein